MSAKHKIRVILKSILGIEINRYNSAQSPAARLGVQLAKNSVDCVLDVGANDGGYGRFLREASYKGDIVSFEPLSDAYTKLLESSKQDCAWHIAPQMALGEVAAKLNINVAGNSASSSLLTMLPSHIESAPESATIGSELVNVHRLDSLNHPIIDTRNRIFLKIDTQGYELQVLRGASTLMNRVVGIQVEMSVVPLYAGQPLYQELFAWLKSEGFELWGCHSGFMDPATGRMLQFDGIFFRPLI
jgi:FkbM family methyltransferase